MSQSRNSSKRITRRKFLSCAGLTAFAGATLGPSALAAGMIASEKKKGKDINLEKVLEFSVGTSLSQLRAVPVDLGGKRRGILAVHSEDANIDPWHAYFRFPKNTLKLTLFTEEGKTLWKRDLGAGVVPGIWFCPVFPFDLNGDGKDEIWFLNNLDPEHPMSLLFLHLERIDASTGETTGQWPWPKPPAQKMSYRYRNFIMGGYSKGEPVLVTAQGTYGPMALQGWNSDLSKRWEYKIGSNDPGARGSHMTPVVDINNDGIDEILWGERAIEVDTGKELFCADRNTWNGHSDVILPLLDRSSGRYHIYTCREKLRTSPRVAMYNDRGERVWGDLERGHIDRGWLARLGDGGESVAMAARIGERGPGGEKLGFEEFTYLAKTGERYPLPFARYDTLPVDLDGDGLHELAGLHRTDERHKESSYDRLVVDRKGEEVAVVEGSIAIGSKFLDRPGEQLLTWTPDGRIHVYADRNARDNPTVKRRCQSHAYRLNQRLTAVGYNKVLLCGL